MAGHGSARAQGIAVALLVLLFLPFNRPESIASRIDASGAWQRAYDDGHYAVWQRPSLHPISDPEP